MGMTWRSAATLIALVPLFAGGCVLKTKYDEALLQMADLEQHLADCEAHGEDLDGQLQECTAAKKGALSQIDELIAELPDLSALERVD